MAGAASEWEQPAAQLAAQVAEILGSGQALLTVNNRSTIAAGEVGRIRQLLEADLLARGVVASGPESANAIRITLSANARERLWVAEVVEGNQTQVTMVHLNRELVAAVPSESGVILQKKRVWTSIDSDMGGAGSSEPVLAALEVPSGLVVLEQEEIVILSKASDRWKEEKRFPINQRRPLARDPRGVLITASDGGGFTAFTSGMECTGSYGISAGAMQGGEWSVQCHESDDPWPVKAGPVASGPLAASASNTRAFYDNARDFFTGVVTPGLGVDVMPFYSIAALPRPAAGHSAFLLNGIDGLVRLADGGALKTVSGTRDWGSDFAALRSGCGAGTQMIASGSGEAEDDSLRAYELPAQEVVAASAPLEMGGAVTALWSSADGTSVWAVVRKGETEYEVDRVTALCP